MSKIKKEYKRLYGNRKFRKKARMHYGFMRCYSASIATWKFNGFTVYRRRKPIRTWDEYKKRNAWWMHAKSPLDDEAFWQKGAKLACVL